MEFEAVRMKETSKLNLIGEVGSILSFFGYKSSVFIDVHAPGINCLSWLIRKASRHGSPTVSRAPAKKNDIIFQYLLRTEHGVLRSKLAPSNRPDLTCILQYGHK
jgi:hypothetical protein